MSLIDITAGKMVVGGDCIGKINGKAVFIPYAIPGERLQVEITSSKKDYDRARIVSIVESSKHRVKPICSLYGVCGGCNMLHIESAYQKTLRTHILKESFEHLSVSIPKIEIVSGRDTGYRNRFQFYDGSLRPADNSIHKMMFHYCPIAAKEINDWLSSTPQNERPSGRIHVFGCNYAAPSLVIEQLPSAQNGSIGRQEAKRRNTRSFCGTLPCKENAVRVRVKDKTIRFDVRGFFQSNMEMLEKTIDVIMPGLHGKRALDMYSGAGTFSVFLADAFDDIIMVEHNRDALSFAEMNITGKEHESYGTTGANWVKHHAASILRNRGQFDAVVIDPPRGGMEQDVCRWLCSFHPPLVRSLSCDPATHARDSSLLVKSGYRLSSLCLLDFYPGTSHIESMASFEY